MNPENHRLHIAGEKLLLEALKNQLAFESKDIENIGNDMRHEFYIDKIKWLVHMINWIQNTSVDHQYLEFHRFNSPKDLPF